MDTITIAETGCYLDNHRGHYITRDVIELAVGYGFIIGPCERFVVDAYEHDCHRESYPFESVIELADEATAWLNSGRDECSTCDGSGKVYSSHDIDRAAPADDPDGVICRACSGAGRGPREPGQNFPPIVPEGCYWSFNDGDFGLYAEDELID